MKHLNEFKAKLDARDFPLDATTLYALTALVDAVENELKDRDAKSKNDKPKKAGSK